MEVGDLVKVRGYIKLIGGWADARSCSLHFPSRRKGLIVKEAVETFSLESFSLVVPRALCPLFSPPDTSL